LELCLQRITEILSIDNKNMCFLAVFSKIDRIFTKFRSIMNCKQIPKVDGGKIMTVKVV